MPVNKLLSLSVKMELAGEEMEFLRGAKCLGVILDPCLSWNVQVDYVIT